MYEYLGKTVPQKEKKKAVIPARPSRASSQNLVAVQRVVKNGTWTDVVRFYYDKYGKRFAETENLKLLHSFYVRWKLWAGSERELSVKDFWTYEVEGSMNNIVKAWGVLKEADISIGIHEKMWEKLLDGCCRSIQIEKLSEFTPHLQEYMETLRDIEKAVKDYMKTYATEDAIEKIQENFIRITPVLGHKKNTESAAAYVKSYLDTFYKIVPFHEMRIPLGAVNSIIKNWFAGMEADDYKKFISYFTEIVKPLISTVNACVLKEELWERICDYALQSYVSGTLMTSDILKNYLEALNNTVTKLIGYNKSTESSSSMSMMVIEEETEKAENEAENENKAENETMDIMISGTEDEGQDETEDNLRKQRWVSELILYGEPWMGTKELEDYCLENFISELVEKPILTDAQKAMITYESIRKLAYQSIYDDTGMEEEAYKDLSAPAYKFEAFSYPFASFKRHDMEGVAYPTLKSMKKKSPRRATKFLDLDAAQNVDKGAFVFLGGKGDYKSLFRELAANAKIKKGDGEIELTNQEVADELVKIMEGRDSILLKIPDCVPAVSKIFTVFLYAEARRHPVALLEAYASLKDFSLNAEKEGYPSSLVEAFDPRGKKTMPLFVPEKGGANMIRGNYDGLSKKKKSQYENMIVKSMDRIVTLFPDTEKIMSATAAIAMNLIKLTKPKEFFPVTESMVEGFIRPTYGISGEKTGERKFSLVKSESTGNNCAFFTLKTLLASYGITVGSDFINYMRREMGLPSMAMVDLIADGESMLRHLARYLLSHNTFDPATVPRFVLHAVINYSGELVDMQDVAHTEYESTGPLLELNFLFNGINHFDAMIPKTS